MTYLFPQLIDPNFEEYNRKYCGSELPTGSWRSQSSLARVRFVSDGSVTDVGYNIFYTFTESCPTGTYSVGDWNEVCRTCYFSILLSPIAIIYCSREELPLELRLGVSCRFRWEIPDVNIILWARGFNWGIQVFPTIKKKSMICQVCMSSDILWCDGKDKHAWKSAWHVRLTQACAIVLPQYFLEKYLGQISHLISHNGLKKDFIHYYCPNTPMKPSKRKQSVILLTDLS